LFSARLFHIFGCSSSTQGQHCIADALRAGAQHRIGLDALQVFADGRTAFFLDCLYQLRGVPLPSVAMPGNFD